MTTTQHRRQPITDVPDPVRWAWHVAALAVVLVAGVVLALRYGSLPDPYPIHYDLTGTADGFAEKGPVTVLLPVIIALGDVVLVAVGDVAQRRSLRARAGRTPGRYDHLDWTMSRSGRVIPLGPTNVLTAVTLAGVSLPTVLGARVAMSLVWVGVAGLIVLVVVGLRRARRR